MYYTMSRGSLLSRNPGRSLLIGGTTAFFVAGVLPAIVKPMDRCSSDSFHRYGCSLHEIALNHVSTRSVVSGASSALHPELRGFSSFTHIGLCFDVLSHRYVLITNCVLPIPHPVTSLTLHSRYYYNSLASYLWYVNRNKNNIYLQL